MGVPMFTVNNGYRDIDVDPFLTTYLPVKIISTVLSCNGLSRCSQWSKAGFLWWHVSFPTWDIPVITKFRRMSCFYLIQTSGRWGQTTHRYSRLCHDSHYFPRCLCSPVRCISSTGGISEPLQENSGRVKDKLPASPPCWSPLLQEV